MVTVHCKKRMTERKVLGHELVKCLKRNKPRPDWKGRPYIKLFQWRDVVIVVDVVSRDILTCWRVGNGDYVE